MKTKRLFSTLALGSLLAMGALAGVKFANGFAEAKADEPATQKLYLAPNIWNQGAGEKYYGWLFGGTTPDQWYTFTADGDYYSAEVAADYTKIIFLRSGPTMEPGWDKDTNYWNRTDNETFGDNNVFTVTAWGDGFSSGTWSKYDPTPVVHTYGLVGTFNEWDPTEALDMTVEGNKATYENLSLSEGDALKLVKDNSWVDAKGYDSLIAASKNYFDRGADGDDNNMIAKADGKYSFEYTISTGELKATFEAVDPVYYVSVAGGDDVELVYDSDIEDEEHNVIGAQYTAKVTVDAADELTFKKNTKAIKPGASDGDGSNNLFYKELDKTITAITAGANLDLFLKVYADGYDTYLTGYTADPNTYYFTNNKGWEGAPRYYAFNNNDVALAAWPGTEMTYVDIDGFGQNRYSFTVDDVKYPNFILVNNDGSDQTINLKFEDLTKNGLYLDVRDAEKENHWTVGEYTYAALTYTLTINEVEVPLTLNEGTEYVAHNVDVLAKDVIGFEVDGVECETSTAKVINNNNLNEFKKVLVDAEDVDVYVDVATKTIWVGGLPNDGYHFIKNGRTLVQLTPYDDYDGYKQYRSEMLTFAEGDTIEMIDTHAGSGKLPVIFHDAEIEEVGLGDKFEIVEGIITCKEDVSARVILKLRGDGNKVYFGEVDEYVQKAIDFAKEFVADITTACGANEETRAAAVKAAWDLKATAYAALSEEAQNALKEGKNSSVLEIRLFGEKYEAIYLKRGTKYALSNFMEWSFEASNYMNEATFDNTIILVITITAAASLCGLALFLAIKKRKHQ